MLTVTCLGVQAQSTWRRTYGGHGVETAASVQQTADGGYVVAGTCGSFGNGASDIYVLRLDASGSLLWSRTFGTNGVEQGLACRELADGFIVAGSTSLGENGGYDMVLIRTDADGDPLWERHFGSPEWDLCNALEVFDDGFLLGGVTYGNGAFAGQAYFVRTDLEGGLIWVEQADETFGSECLALSGTPSGSFAAAGRAGAFNGYDDGYLAFYDLDGEQDWMLAAGGDSVDRLNGVVVAADGRVVANGVTASENDFTQIHLVGASADGSLEWERFIGNEVDAGGSAIAEAHGSGYVITGFNTLNFGERDMIFTRTDQDGIFQFGNNYGNGQPANGNAIARTNDGGYVLAGWSENYGPGVRSVYVVKVDENGQTELLTVVPSFDPVGVEESVVRGNAVLVSSLVTPSMPLRFVEGASLDAHLSVFDMKGRMVHQTNLPAGATSIALPHLTSGHYCGSILNGSGWFSFRFAVIDW